MARFVRLNSPGPQLSPDTRIIKAAEYATYRDAQQLVAEAERDAAEIREQAKQHYEDEKRRGYEEGQADAKEELAERMMEMVSESVNYFASAEAEVAKVVMICVRKILGDFDDEELAIRVAKNALQVVRNESRVTLRVRPEQEMAIKQRLSEVTSGRSDISYLDVVGDDRLEKGGCRLETDVGVVDASLDLQLKVLESVLQSRVDTDAQASAAG